MSIHRQKYEDRPIVQPFYHLRDNGGAEGREEGGGSRRGIDASDVVVERPTYRKPFLIVFQAAARRVEAARHARNRNMVLPSYYPDDNGGVKGRGGTSWYRCSC